MSKIGLKNVSEGNTELALALSITPALSFAPDNMVSVSFHLVIEEIKEVSEVLKLEKESLYIIGDLTYFSRRTKLFLFYLLSQFASSILTRLSYFHIFCFPLLSFLGNFYLRRDFTTAYGCQTE